MMRMQQLIGHKKKAPKLGAAMDCKGQLGTGA